MRIKFQESPRPVVLKFELSLKSMQLGHFNARILNRDVATVYTSEVLDSESGRFLCQQVLTLQSPVVTIHTTCLTNKEFCVLLTVYVYMGFIRF